MVHRTLAGYLQWYVRHKRSARAISVLLAVGVFAFWWVVFGLKVAVVVEAVIVAVSVLQWIAARRRLARR